MPASLFGGLKKRRERQESQDTADKELDDALKLLADATKRNTEACEKVKRRQSSGKLKLVSIPPGE